MKIAAVLFLFFITLKTQAQRANLDSMWNLLKKEIPKGYSFRKLYKAHQTSARQEFEYEYYFSKDSLYHFNLGSRSNGFIITIFDEKREKMTESYYNNIFHETLSFQPAKSEVYYVRHTFKSSISGYEGVSILSAKPK